MDERATIQEAAHSLWQRLNGNSTSHRDFVATIGVGGGAIHLYFCRKSHMRRMAEQLIEWQGYPVESHYSGVPRLN